MYYILPVSFFGQCTKYAGFNLTYMHFQDMQSIHFFQNQTTPHPTTPPPPPTQHVLYVPVIRNYNISGQMHVLCIRNFVTYAELMQTGKWSLLKIRGL